MSLWIWTEFDRRNKVYNTKKNGMAFGDPHLLAVNCKSNVGTQTVYNLDVIGGT